MNNIYVVSKFKLENESEIKLKNCLSIMYSHTFAISQIICKEYWGNDCKKLYYYLDYTFRARYHDNMVNTYQFINGNIIGIYCLNLYKSNDIPKKYPLYLVFHFNKNADNRYQRWYLNPGLYSLYIICLV